MIVYAVYYTDWHGKDILQEVFNSQALASEYIKKKVDSGNYWIDERKK